jgi:predicted secreted hydrolase
MPVTGLLWREHRTRLVGVVALLVALLAGCATATPPTLPPAPTVTPAPTLAPSGAPWRATPPVPLELPRDEAPHDVLTEWWYYTGHLGAATGERYGFEFVIFQVRLGDGVPTYMSHVAVTDQARGRFVYDQRASSGAQPQPAAGGFALAVGDWSMRGLDGRDQVQARVADYAFDLALTAMKAPALHLGTGYISFGPAGDSYYYSRTRLAVQGTVIDNGVTRPVTGTAWFDKQWGDFLSVKGGGWDWYALHLDDGSEVMLFDVRDPAGRPAIAYGTVVGAGGDARDLPPGSYSVEAVGQWTSPRSGATYPSGWRIRVPGEHLDLRVTPVLADQELDTRATTGVVYWEGAVRVEGQRASMPITGRGYVELTGYAR